MKILAIDSSGLPASVALCEEDILFAEYTIQYKKTHSQTLLPMLEELKKMTELDLETVDAIAVASGPGSFTGLRIGSATAKGLGLALEKPIVEVPTLQGLAYNVYGTKGLICPMLDARRNQVYAGVYRFAEADTDGGKPVRYILETVAEQCAMEVSKLLSLLEQKGEHVTFLGDGAAVYGERIAAEFTLPYSIAPLHMNRQRAASVAALAMEYARAGRMVCADKHRPEYLRLSQAERERMENKEITIRRMTEADAEEAGRLEAACFSRPWSAQAFRDTLQGGNALYLAACCGEKIVGCCGVINGCGDGNISNVAVAAPYRRKGLGRRMVQTLMEEGAKLGIRNYTLEVRAGNVPAICLYESMGFRREGIRPGFYEKPSEDALILWKRQEE